MSDKPITVTYRDVIITYREKDNRWCFELRGRDRSAESLAKAKEFIDKPAPSEKEEKPFKPIRAWYKDYGYEFHPCSVTSIAESPSWKSDKEVWVTFDGGKRAKVAADTVIETTAPNALAIAGIRDRQKEIERLQEEIRKFADKLTKVKL